VVWRKVLWLVVVSGCVERKSDVGRGQGKVSLDVWLLALLGLCLRATQVFYSGTCRVPALHPTRARLPRWEYVASSINLSASE
jgi:hypothetical protein